MVEGREGSAVPVRMCECVVLREHGTFICPGLGSCVAVIVFDPVIHLAGVAHIMLPKAFEDDGESRPVRFADVGVRYLISKLEEMGMKRRSMKVAIVGGARVIRLGSESQMDIGTRNVDAVKAALAEAGVSLSLIHI